MSNLSFTYPVFEDSQVLTSAQLNDLVIYLDEQNRLTRTKLVGVGVMCGLVPSFAPNPLVPPGPSIPGTISVTTGAGVTTEGYLLQLPDTVYDRYRKYTLAEGATYDPFINQDTLEQFPIWEALPQAYVPEPFETIFTIDDVFAKDMVAVLFLEKVDVDLQSCLGKSCDNLGIERTFNQRLLLISKAVIDEMIEQHGLAMNLNFPGKFDLPDYVIRRPLYDPSNIHSTDYFRFSEQYKNALQNVYLPTPGDPLRPGIIETIRQTFTIFQPLLETVYPNGQDPLPVSVLPVGGRQEWKDIINGSTVGNLPAYLGIQYVYDFVKDLILAYNEFRSTAFDLMSECCVSSTLFPLHLFLGEIFRVEDCKPSKYRHDFIAAPVTNEQKVARQKLIILHQRMVMMLKHFDSTIIHNPPTASLPAILVTPSCEKRDPLSLRAIPYYLKANAIDAELGITLESVWNSVLVRECKKDALGEYPVQSWRNQEGDPFTASTPVKTPLFFDADPYNFFRIEGHIRWKVNDALAQINLWKHFFDLPLNVIALRLKGQASTAEILARCNFADLRSQYGATRNELDCFLRRIYDHFFVTDTSTGVPHTTPRAFPSFVNRMSADALVEGGSSSVSFMPPQVLPFSTPGVPGPDGRLPATIVYNPRSLQAVQADVQATLNALLLAMDKVLLFLPPTLDQFNFGSQSNAQSFISAYMTMVNLAINLKQFIMEGLDQLVKSTRTRFPQEAYFVLAQWASEYFWFINELVIDCRFRSLERIYFELQYRINHMKTNDPTVFSNFIEKHPGIDHKAGVARGNTFVLIYPGEPVTIVNKGRDIIAATAVTITSLVGELAVLDSVPNPTNEQTARRFQVADDLCKIYKDQYDTYNATTVPGKDKPTVPNTPVAVSAPIFRTNIASDQVVADFTLPYLATCDCDCTDIPSPTLEQLAIPALNIPVLLEYKTGDYALTDDTSASTTGCYNPGEALPSLTIPVTPLFDSTLGQRIRLLVVISTAGATGTSRVTVKGGQVSVVDFDAKGSQAFRYTPNRTFLGVDHFDYVFEVYDFFGNVKLRSNRARITITVVPRCNAVSTPINTAIEIPIGGEPQG